MENIAANDFSVILLAAGSGLRMGGDTKKQFIKVSERPLIYYPLRAFEECGAGEIVLVVAAEDMDFVKQDIIGRFGFTKVSAIVSGGAERYLSVYEGLKRVTKPYVLVHDGARACVTAQVIEAVMRETAEYEACEAAVPSVDTVKLADDNGFVKMTPDRSRVWSIQTPQGFRTELLREAYERLFAVGKVSVSVKGAKRPVFTGKGSTVSEKNVSGNPFTGITDDAMVVERAFPDQKIRLVMGSYDNIKVTTPKDLAIVEGIL